jgi:hypothetical protein
LLEGAKLRISKAVIALSAVSPSPSAAPALAAPKP